MVGCPVLSISVCPRSKSWYQRGFRVCDPENSEIVFISIAIRRTGALLEMCFFFKKWFCLKGCSKIFAGLRKLELHKSICNHVYSFPLIFIIESITMSPNWPIDHSKINVGVVGSQMFFGPGSDSGSLTSEFGYCTSKKEKRWTTKFHKNWSHCVYFAISFGLRI